MKEIGSSVFCEATISAHQSSMALKRLAEMDKIFWLTQTKARELLEK